jgi:N-acylglucosamine-6-phosphate 2-epimerase
MTSTILDRLGGGLVVSCQASPGHPLRDPEVIGLLAECAQLAGAAGLRINGTEDIRAARRRTDLPIIGLYKVRDTGPRYFITPGIEYAEQLAAAGAQMIAIEVTDDVPGDPLALVKRIRADLGLPVMADVSTLEEGRRAWDAGAEVVGTTLSGYTSTSGSAGAAPDIALVRNLADHGIRTVAEGRYSTPEHVRDAYAAGAWSIVIGTAITDPVAIARQLVHATPCARQRLAHG